MKKSNKYKETITYFKSIGDLSHYVNECFVGHCIVPLDELPQEPFVNGYFRVTVTINVDKFMIDDQDERLADDIKPEVK